MPKKTTVITREEKDDSKGDDIERDATPEEKELAEWAESIPGGVIIKLYKIQNGREAWCGDTDPRTVNENYLYRNFGSGRYHLKGTINGKFIANAYKEVNIYEPESRPEEIAAGYRGFYGDGDREPDRDRTDILLAQINRQHELVLEMIKAQGNAKHDMSDLVQLAQLLKENNQQPDVASMLPSMVDLFKTVLETSKDVTQGEDPKMSWLKLGMQALDKVQPILNQMITAKRQGAAGVMEMPQAEELLRHGIKRLKEKFEQNKDPIFQADQILDNMDDPLYKTIALQLVNMPFEDFGNIDPEIVKPPMRQWFLALYNQLHQSIKEMQNDEETEAFTGPGGSGADLEGNEAPDGSGDSQPGSPKGGA